MLRFPYSAVLGSISGGAAVEAYATRIAIALALVAIRSMRHEQLQPRMETHTVGLLHNL